MTSKHWLAIALAVALTAVSAHARIGETQNEITQRYGVGTKDDATRLPGTDRFNYLKNGFDVEVMFAAGKSVTEVLHRKDKEITDDDIKGLLNVNARFARSASPGTVIVFSFMGALPSICVLRTSN